MVYTLSALSVAIATHDLIVRFVVIHMITIASMHIIGKAVFCDL